MLWYMPGFEIQSHGNMLNAKHRSFSIIHAIYSMAQLKVFWNYWTFLILALLSIELLLRLTAKIFDTKSFIEVSDCMATSFRKFVKVSYFCNNMWKTDRGGDKNFWSSQKAFEMLIILIAVECSSRKSFHPNHESL